MNMAVIKITLEKEVFGYWDGGAKDYFEFFVQKPELESDGKSFYSKIGSFMANYWFNIGAGKNKPQSIKSVVSNALRRIKKNCRFEIKSIEVVYLNGGD